MDLARDLQAHFRRLDPDYGVVPLWWWDAEPIVPERLRWQMAQMAAGGVRQLVVINLAPTGPNQASAGSDPAFYTPAWWECFQLAVMEAERLGMFLWYYDQIGFSGANFPARLIVQHPEYRGYRLVRWRRGASAPPGSSPVAEDGTWRYGTVRTGFDWLNPAAGAHLLDLIHGEMERRLGQWFGRVIRGSFQDELPPMPTWQPAVLSRYATRFGEDLRPRIGDLFDSGPGHGQTRRRVYGILADLAETAWFRPLGEWHRRRHLLLGSDQAGPGREMDPYGAGRLYLDYPRMHRWFSAPGNDPDGETKAHSSLAHLGHGERVWLEAFHSSGWGPTLEEIWHWLLPWYQAGATLYNPHAVYYSTRGGWWEWAPPDTGFRQPYWEHYPLFAAAVTRLSWILSQGTHRADVAVYYPGRHLWGHMPWPDGTGADHAMDLARRPADAEAERIRGLYWAVVGRQNRNRPEVGALRAGHWDFDVVDDGALERARSTADGLVIDPERYGAVILPGAEPVEETGRQALQRFLDDGGLVIGVGLPMRARRLAGVKQVDGPHELDAILNRRLARRCRATGLSLERHLPDGTRVFLVLPPGPHLIPMHEAAVAASTVPEEQPFLFRGGGRAEQWDLLSGAARRLDAVALDRETQVTVSFREAPAALVVVRPDDAAPDGTAPADATVLPARVPPASALDGARVLPDRWTLTLEPTLDNRWGDFDRHDTGVGVEIRRVDVRVEATPGEGSRNGWAADDGPSSAWVSRLWSEAATWRCRDAGSDTEATRVVSSVFGDMTARRWAGRMGRVSRLFLNLGRRAAGETATARSHVRIPTDGVYWLQVEGPGIKSVVVDEVPWVVEGPQYAALLSGFLSAGWHAVTLTVAPTDAGDVRVGAAISSVPPRLPLTWFLAPGGASGSWRAEQTVQLPATFDRVRLHAVVYDASLEVEFNGRVATRLGDFMPYSRWGQHVVDLTADATPGPNRLCVRLESASPAAQFLLDGLWEAGDARGVFGTDGTWRTAEGRPFASGSARPEDHWLYARPHLLPDVGWLEPDAVPAGILPWVLDPNRVGAVVWLRARLPIGATSVTVRAAGTVAAWVNGAPVPTSGERLQFPPVDAGALLTLAVTPAGLQTEAAVLQAPLIVETTPHAGGTGDWRTRLALPTYSGAVVYETVVDGFTDAAVLDLGRVRGTAEVFVDGQSAGVRLWHPYRFDCSPLWGPGRHQIRIRVTNTLGAYYSDGKPTVFGSSEQAAGGLFGPVLLAESGRG